MGSIGLAPSPSPSPSLGARNQKDCPCGALRYGASSIAGIEILFRGTRLIARGGRKSLVREPVTSGRPLSKEGIAVVLALKGAKDKPQELDEVFATKVSRLLKRDLLEVLKELERQNECDLSLKIFETIRGEHWFKPDFSLYRRLFGVMWENGRVEDMVYIFEQVKLDGMQPDYFLVRELMVAQLKHRRPSAAMELYDAAKAFNFHFNEKTYWIVTSELKACGQNELAALVESDFARAFPLREKATT